MNNHPAFPFSGHPGVGKGPLRPNTGMSMLDYFAAASLAGIRAHDKKTDSATVAELAYRDAVAMLNQKNQQP